MKKFRVIRKDPGLKSGSREVSLTKALKYPVYNSVQEIFILPQSFEALRSGLKFQLKGRQSYWSSEISGLQSGSREICLLQGSQALKSGLRISGSKRN